MSRAKKITAWLLYGLIFLMPWVVWPPLAEPFEFPKVLVYLLLVVFVLLVNIDIIIYICIKYVKSGEVITISLLLWLLWLGVGSLLSQDPMTSLFGQPYRYWGWFSLLLLGVVFVMMRSAGQFSLTTRVIERILALGHALVVVIIGGQALAMLAGLPVYTFYGRMTAFLGNPNFTAQYLVVTFPFAFYWHRRISVGWHRKLYIIGLSLASFLAVLLTGSRAGLAVLGAEIALLLFLQLAQSRWRWVVVGGVVLVTVVGAVWLFAARTPSAFDTRTTIWLKSVQAIGEKPAVGWGVEQFATAFSAQLTPGDFDLLHIRVDRAHNDLLETMVAGGVVAGVAYLVFWGSILVKLWRIRKKPAVWIYLLSLGAFFLMAQVNVVSSAVYLTAFVVAGLALHKFTATGILPAST